MKVWESFAPGTFVSSHYVEIYWDVKFFVSKIECLHLFGTLGMLFFLRMTNLAPRCIQKTTDFRIKLTKLFQPVNTSTTALIHSWLDKIYTLDKILAQNWSKSITCTDFVDNMLQHLNFQSIFPRCSRSVTFLCHCHRQKFEEISKSEKKTNWLG